MRGFGFGVLLDYMEVLTRSYTDGLFLLTVGNASPDEIFTKLGGMFGSQGAVWKEFVNVDWWTSASKRYVRETGRDQNCSGLARNSR